MECLREEVYIYCTDAVIQSKNNKTDLPMSSFRFCLQLSTVTFHSPTGNTQNTHNDSYQDPLSRHVWRRDRLTLHILPFFLFAIVPLTVQKSLLSIIIISLPKVLFFCRSIFLSIKYIRTFVIPSLSLSVLRVINSFDVMWDIYRPNIIMSIRNCLYFRHELLEPRTV